MAWHDGPDWAGRAEDPAIKEQETARLAALVPEPTTRRNAPPGDLPDVLVQVRGDAAPRTRGSVLAQDHRDLMIGERRRPGGPTSAGGPGSRIEVVRPAATDRGPGGGRARSSSGTWRRSSCGWTGGRAAVAVATRAVGRSSRWRGRLAPSEVWDAAFGRAQIDV